MEFIRTSGVSSGQQKPLPTCTCVACIQACTTACVDEVVGASSSCRARGHSAWISTSIASHHMPAGMKTQGVQGGGVEAWSSRTHLRSSIWQQAVRTDEPSGPILASLPAGIAHLLVS